MGLSLDKHGVAWDYVEGYVTGFSKEEISKLRVNVAFKTTGWFDQGTVEVNDDGTWKCSGRFVSDRERIIKATLKNLSDKIIAIVEIYSVTR